MCHRTSKRRLRAAATVALFASLPISPTLAVPQNAVPAAAPAPATAAVASAAIDDDFDADVRVFNDHIVTLANPFMEGRAPGSRGMEIAKEYFEYYLRRAGVEPGFDNGTSYRQPFPLGGTLDIARQSIVAHIGDTQLTFAPDVEQVATSMGASMIVTGPMVFVGYSIDNGPDGYSNYGTDTDLSGKVAIMYRFGPMDENGKSLWSGSLANAAASIDNKIRGASERGAAGIIILNPPITTDPSASQLISDVSGAENASIPIMMMSAEAGSRLLEAASDRSALALRRYADAGGGTVTLDGTITISADIDRRSLMAENVGGLLPGRGRLRDEYIVIGAHLDHLGMVDSGARSGAGDVYTGADDNASGSAAVLLLADKLAAEYAALPASADARSILFIGFSAEESQLKGSQHYVSNPIAPIQNHDLMINLDMIGRIENGGLNVTGSNSAQGFAVWLDPFYDRSDLRIVKTDRYKRGRSDHSSFRAKGVPILFAIMAGDLHEDYHTPGDVSWKINREDSVRTVYLFRDIALAAAQRSERLVFSSGDETVAVGSTPRVPPPPAQPPQGQAPGGARVRLGIQPSDYDSTNGVPVGAVTGNGPADKAGMRAGDIIITWNGKAVKTIGDYMDFTGQSEPGEVVIIGVRRGENVLVLKVTLEDAGG